MPYGISDELWAMLPPEDQAAIAASYEGATSSTPTYYSPVTAEELGDVAPGGGGHLGGSAPTAAYQDYLDLFAYLTGGTDQVTPGAQQYFETIEGGDIPGVDYRSPSLFLGGDDTGGFVGSLPAFPGAGSGIREATFSPVDISIAGAPEWWQAVAPDVFNPISEYQTFANLLIPFLSPEDQRTVASNLFQSAPKQFAAYDPETLEPLAPPQEITPDLRSRFFTGERAQDTLDAFDQLLAISGKDAEDLGPGYGFLRGLADTLRDVELTSGARQLTETQQGQLLAALDPQLAQTESGPLSAFGPLARSFVNPFFSAGSLTGNVRNQFGDVIRPPNPRYF